MSEYKFTIKPYIGANDIVFDMSRDRARKILGGFFDSFKRNEFGNVVDSFSNNNIFLYYDNNDILEAIEFSEDVDLFIESDSLPKEFDSLKNMLIKMDPDLIDEGDHMTSFNMGIGAQKNYENGNYSSVIVFRFGYYS